MSDVIHKYGWKKDHTDFRDHVLSLAAPMAGSLPASVDLRPLCSPVYDQGQLGSCTGNCLAGLFEFTQDGEKLIDFMPSRLYIYYNERVIEGTVNEDAGAEIRNGIKTLAAKGVCREELWPYKISKFAVKPPAECYSRASIHKALKYARVPQTEWAVKTVLASGHPFVFGFTCYDSFESQAVAQTGILPMPLSTESALGGHAVMCVGYDDSDKTFLVRNSWGADWGIGGYFKMPYAYLLDPNLADDLWVLNLVGASITPSH